MKKPKPIKGEIPMNTPFRGSGLIEDAKEETKKEIADRLEQLACQKQFDAKQEKKAAKKLVALAEASALLTFSNILYQEMNENKFDK